MNILVIGGKGFTGTCLVPLLKHRNPGGAVAVASRSSDTVRMDLSDAESVSRLLREKQWDQVVCLAACVRSPDREDFVQTNIRGMENLIRGLRDSPFTGRLLVVGSSAVYGELPPWDSSASGDQESHAATHPVSAYGETLLERESVVREGTNNQPFSSVITRTFNLIGPGLPDPFAFARFAERTHRLLRGEVNAVEVGPLDAIRDFVDVRDACRGYQDLLGHAHGTRRNLHRESLIGARAPHRRFLPRHRAPGRTTYPHPDQPGLGESAGGERPGR